MYFCDSSYKKIFEAFALNLVIENWRLNNHEMISKMLTSLAWAHLFVVRYRQYPDNDIS
jgi:hypothetical protein